MTRAEAAVLAALVGRRADSGGDMRFELVEGPAKGMLSSTISISDFSGENDNLVWVLRGRVVAVICLDDTAGADGCARARATGLGWLETGLLSRWARLSRNRVGCSASRSST